MRAEQLGVGRSLLSFPEIWKIGETSCETFQSSSPWPANGKNAVPCDPIDPSLRIMAGRSGAEVWIHRLRGPAGKLRQQLMGSLPALSLADARSEWRNLRASRDKHGDPRNQLRRRQEAANTAVTGGKGDEMTGAAEICQGGAPVQARAGHEQWSILEPKILPEVGRLLGWLS